MGFEPTVRCRTLVFKTSAFDRSANSPEIARTMSIVTGFQGRLGEIGTGGGSRTPACGFGDRRATITLHRLKLFTSSTKKAPNIISARGLLNITF